MAVTDVGKFFAIASQDTEIWRRITEGPNGLPDILNRIVSEGKLLGITFTPDDAAEWISEQNSSPAGSSASGPAPPEQAKMARMSVPVPGQVAKNPQTILPPPVNSPKDILNVINWLGSQVPPGYGGGLGGHGHGPGRRR